jgi:hypothetical protein
MATLGFDEGSNGENFVNSHNRALIPVDVDTISIDYKVWAYAYQCHLVEDNDGATGHLRPTALIIP